MLAVCGRARSDHQSSSLSQAHVALVRARLLRHGDDSKLCFRSANNSWPSNAEPRPTSDRRGQGCLAGDEQRLQMLTLHRDDMTKAMTTSDRNRARFGGSTLSKVVMLRQTDG